MTYPLTQYLVPTISNSNDIAPNMRPCSACLAGITSMENQMAFAELLHERTRKDFWGYAKAEELSSKELIEEKREAEDKSIKKKYIKR